MGVLPDSTVIPAKAGIQSPIVILSEAKNPLDSRFRGNDKPSYKFIIFLIILVSALALPRRVFCYDTSVAHPNIAQMAGLLLNKNSNKKLTAEEIGWLMDGACEEDTPTRWINHFYDPVNNIGLKNTELSAKNWAKNPTAQTQFSLGDKSWQRALADWKKGDRENAYKELGHIIHLISDMHVPAHTRDDIHVIGDSYEQFVKNNWNNLYPEIKSAIPVIPATSVIPAKAGILDNIIPVSNLSFLRKQESAVGGEPLSLVNIFNTSATYSNESFYSDDTILSGDYINPNITLLRTENISDGNKLYQFLVNNQGIKLCWKDKARGWSNIIQDDGIATCILKHDLVLTSYSHHLIPKAITQSSNIIQLFFTEAEKNTEQSIPIARVAPKGYLDRGASFVINAGEDLLNYLKGKFGGNNVALGQSAGVMTSGDGQSALTPPASPPQGGNLATPPMQNTPNPVLPDLSARGGPALGGKGVGKTVIRQTSNKITPAATPPFSQSLPPANTWPEQGGYYDEPYIPKSGGGQSSGGGSYAGGGWSSGGGSTPPANQPQQETPTTTPDISPTPTSTPTSTPNPTPTSTPASDTTPPPTPILDNFFNQIIYTTSSAYDIFGICSTDTAKIVWGYATDTPTLALPPVSSTGQALTGGGEIAPTHPSPLLLEGNTDIWNLAAPLAPGHNYFSFASADADFNTSTFSEPAQIISDNIAPPTTTISAEELPTTSGWRVTLTGADELSPTFYDLWYAVFGTSTVWQSVATSSPSNIIDIPTPRGQSYLFRARALDILGNTSPWSDEITSSTPIRLDWSKEIVINEIAWAGTISDSTGQADEWIELYNNTGQPIDLNNWKIRVIGKLSAPDRDIVFTTSTIIAANGYFLWERTDDSAVQNISADSTSTLKNGLSNLGEHIKLINPAGETIDEVDCSAGWFAGNAAPEPYRAMARLDSRLRGNDSSNWQSSRGPWIEALAYDNLIFPHLIYGSPKAPNTQTLAVLSGTQSAPDLTLTKENGPYFINNYTVFATATLRINPGVEIYLPQYGYFFVNGNLEINGATGTPVNFLPAPSTTMWANIIFTGATANIQYANFLRGNLESPRTVNDGSLYFSSSTAILDNVFIWNSRAPGKSINSLNSNLTIKNSSIGADVKYPNNGVPGVDTTGIRVKGGRLNLENTLFTNLIMGVDGGSILDNFPQLQITNMPAENFINVDYPWQPSNWPALIATSTP